MLCPDIRTERSSACLAKYFFIFFVFFLSYLIYHDPGQLLHQVFRKYVLLDTVTDAAGTLKV